MLYFRVSDFEFTPECIVFDLLSIGLYHGWLVDPQNTDTASAVGGLSYNQLVEKIIASKQEGAESQLVSEGNKTDAHPNPSPLYCHFVLESSTTYVHNFKVTPNSLMIVHALMIASLVICTCSRENILQCRFLRYFMALT